jgi:hypothetical protein
MPKEAIAAHIKSSCKKLYQLCIIGCGAKILVQEMDSHTKNYCPKREVLCVLCSEPVWAEEMEEHVSKLCSDRYDPCPNNCDVGQIKLKDREHHMIFECKRRQISCACGDVMLFCEHADHMIADCPKKLGIFKHRISV